MGEVNVDDLKAGMLLASDLKDAKGRFLLGRGVPIEDKHIRIMKIWGITAADISGVNREDISTEIMNRFDPQLWEIVKSAVDNMLCNSIRDFDALQELKRVCILRAAEKLSTTPGQKPLHANNDELTNGGVSEPLWETQPKERISSLDDLVDKNVQLSSFPDIYYQIQNVMNDTHSSATHLANVVSKDPGLSATLLKLVNSAFFGLPTKLDSITRAIALIGGRELSALAMGISVIRFFRDIPPTLIDMKNFWLHSVACGIFSRILANHKREFQEELFFIGGLLHDIGRLIMFSEYPKTSAYIIALADKRHSPLYVTEREVLGYDHTQVTGKLLEKWNFPKNLENMIRNHHAPTRAKNPPEASIILIADIIASALGYGFSGSRYVPAFEKEVWNILGLSPSVLAPSIKQADRQITETLQVFNMDGD